MTDKPRIYCGFAGWLCLGCGVCGFGATVVEAYESWAAKNGMDP